MVVRHQLEAGWKFDMQMVVIVSIALQPSELGESRTSSGIRALTVIVKRRKKVVNTHIMGMLMKKLTII
jgi:hypothetical protein